MAQDTFDVLNPATAQVLRTVHMASPDEIDAAVARAKAAWPAWRDTAPGIKADELLKNADMALYRAKADGRGTYCFFRDEMAQTVEARRIL